jgi:hypothetical protein
LQAPRIADPVEKRSQLLIRAHNETLSVIAMRVRNQIGCRWNNRCDTTATPTGPAQIVIGDFHYSPTIAFVSLGKYQQGTKQRRSSEVYVGRLCSFA